MQQYGVISRKLLILLSFKEFKHVNLDDNDISKVQGDTITAAWKSDSSSHNYYDLYASIKPSSVGGISLSYDLTYKAVIL